MPTIIRDFLVNLGAGQVPDWLAWPLILIGGLLVVLLRRRLGQGGDGGQTILSGNRTKLGDVAGRDQTKQTGLINLNWAKSHPETPPQLIPHDHASKNAALRVKVESAELAKETPQVITGVGGIPSSETWGTGGRVSQKPPMAVQDECDKIATSIQRDLDRPGVLNYEKHRGRIRAALMPKLEAWSALPSPSLEELLNNPAAWTYRDARDVVLALRQICPAEGERKG